MYTPKNIRRARGSQRAQRTRDRKLPRTGPKLTLEAERPGSGETEQYHGYRCNRSSGRYHALTIRTRRARAPNAAYGPNITSNGSGTNRNYQNPSHAPVPSPSGRPPACVLAEVARDARARGTRARSGSGTSRCSMLTWIEWKSTGALQTRTATRTSPRPSSRPRDTSTSAGGSPRQENAHARVRPGPGSCRPVRRAPGRRRQEHELFLLRCSAVGARGGGGHDRDGTAVVGGRAELGRPAPELTCGGKLCCHKTSRCGSHGSEASAATGDGKTALRAFGLFTVTVDFSGKLLAVIGAKLASETGAGQERRSTPPDPGPRRTPNAPSAYHAFRMPELAIARDRPSSMPTGQPASSSSPQTVQISTTRLIPPISAE